MNELLLDPYCGPAPSPGELLSRWNLDPLILLAMASLMMGWLLWGRKDRAGRWAIAGSQFLVLVVFVSPLCALASALFSVRVLHHVVLIAGIAPLVAIALPWRSGPLLPLSALVVLHAAVVWIWHAPDPYLVALASQPVYWAMQLTLGATAYLLWREVLSPLTQPGHAALSLLATIMQMGFLGALLVFAPQPVFIAHLTTTQAFGLTPLEDQQLSGLLMWVPAIAPYVGVALIKLGYLVSPRARMA